MTTEPALTQRRGKRKDAAAGKAGQNDNGGRIIVRAKVQSPKSKVQSLTEDEYENEDEEDWGRAFV
jgi:hypothetical protein